VAFPDPRSAGLHQILAVGRDLRPGTLLSAYRQGIFPWPHSAMLIPWCSPDPRAIFPLEQAPHWSRSLRRTLRLRRFEVTLDEDFAGVMRACAGERPEGTWIYPSMIEAYTTLHRLGWAHSVEVWEAAAGGGRALVGGIYGLAIGGLFAGESMFHRRTDASKIAFASLVDRLRSGGFELFDVQVPTDHLMSLGCITVERPDYLTRLERAVKKPARLG
jgi:leucyl/phenylalanyl-tRNA--protein transferase